MRPRAVAGVDAEVRLTPTMAERRLEVVRATPGRVGALAPLFGRAFVEEPMTLWSSGERGDVEVRLTSAFACFLEQVLGLGLVWETTGGLGAAVWVPPGSRAGRCTRGVIRRSSRWLKTAGAMRRSGTGWAVITRPSRCGCWTRSRWSLRRKVGDLA